MASKIDFVVPWVDGSDPEWQKEKCKYKGEEASDIVRFRDWDLMKFFFRGIDKFATWVNKVYFITWGHLPEWLNTDNPKLRIIRHDEYIPDRFLPTFSANPIELNLHRIKELSEYFVYFNDDTFIINPVSKEDFFVGNKPCDMAVLYPNYVNGTDNVFDHMFLNDAEFFARHFDIKKVVKRDRAKWFNLKNGFNNLLKTACMMPFPFFTGLMLHHQPQSLKKSTLVSVWEKEKELLERVCLNRFRSESDVNQYIFRYWQIGNGDYYPMNLQKRGTYIPITKDMDYSVINSSNYKMICLNDIDSNLDFESVKSRLKDEFSKRFPEKSSFEV